MVDVVVNHFGWAGNGTTVDYSMLEPFDDEKYFHSYCEISSSTNMTDAQEVSGTTPTSSFQIAIR